MLVRTFIKSTPKGPIAHTGESKELLHRQKLSVEVKTVCCSFVTLYRYFNRRVRGASVTRKLLLLPRCICSSWGFSLEQTHLCFHLRNILTLFISCWLQICQWEKKHFNFVYIFHVGNGRKYQVSDEYWTCSITSFTSIFHCKVMFDGILEPWAMIACLFQLLWIFDIVAGVQLVFMCSANSPGKDLTWRSLSLYI